MVSSGVTFPALQDFVAQGPSKQTINARIGLNRASTGEILTTQPGPDSDQSADPRSNANSKNNLRNDLNELLSNPPNTEGPTGPPPAFKETFLARQARVALDPRPDLGVEPIGSERQANAETKQTPTERTEAAISEVRSLEEKSEPSVDQRN